MEKSGVLFTVGHGNLDRRSLGGLLGDAGIQQLVDVRRFPGSRTNRDVRRDELSRWLPDLGIDYRWEQRLGGRRRLPTGETSLDPWWTVAAFRAYAAHTRTVEFAAALDDIVIRTSSTHVAIMCAETLWWRCHRRLIADVVVLIRSHAVRPSSDGGRSPVRTSRRRGCTAGRQRSGAVGSGRVDGCHHGTSADLSRTSPTTVNVRS
jgi:uncharacterized protein (DUF488 family)